MYVSFIVSFIVRCRVSEEIKCSVWGLGVIGDNCMCVCGCELCGLIGDKVVSKVMLVRCSPEVVGVLGGVGVGGTAGAAHSSPSVLGIGVGECRSEGICACSVHKSR